MLSAIWAERRMQVGRKPAVHARVEVVGPGVLAPSPLPRPTIDPTTPSAPYPPHTTYQTSLSTLLQNQA